VVGAHARVGVNHVAREAQQGRRMLGHVCKSCAGHDRVGARGRGDAWPPDAGCLSVPCSFARVLRTCISLADVATPKRGVASSGRRYRAHSAPNVTASASQGTRKQGQAAAAAAKNATASQGGKSVRKTIDSHPSALTLVGGEVSHDLLPQACQVKVEKEAQNQGVPGPVVLVVAQQAVDLKEQVKVVESCACPGPSPSSPTTPIPSVECQEQVGTGPGDASPVAQQAPKKVLELVPANVPAPQVAVVAVDTSSPNDGHVKPQSQGQTAALQCSVQSANDTLSVGLKAQEVGGVASFVPQPWAGLTPVTR
jgi:hypothetical protein